LQEQIVVRSIILVTSSNSDSPGDPADAVVDAGQLVSPHDATAAAAAGIIRDLFDPIFQGLAFSLMPKGRSTFRG
jgi:hypothetical protein